MTLKLPPLATRVLKVKELFPVMTTVSVPFCRVRPVPERPVTVPPMLKGPVPPGPPVLNAAWLQAISEIATTPRNALKRGFVGTFINFICSFIDFGKSWLRHGSRFVSGAEFASRKRVEN